MFPELLRRGIWHTTSVERFDQILADGQILPNPNLPESERWGTRIGSVGYPYVRHLDGVSLFDFEAFDENEYANRYPLSNWQAFVPCLANWSAAIWIELDVYKMGNKLIRGQELLKKWKEENSSRRFMPMIEAAHIGPIPVFCFRTAYKYSQETWQVVELRV